MNLLALIGTVMFAGASAISPTTIEQPHRAFDNITQYPFSAAGSTFYRTSENKVIFTPITVVIDFEDDSVYSNTENKIDTSAFRANWSGIEVALVNTSGSYRSSRFSHYMSFSFTTVAGEPVLQVANTFYNANTYSASTVNFSYDTETNYHTMAIEFKYLANGTGSDTVIRWGDEIYTISTPFTSNVYEVADAGDTTNNTAFRMYRNGSSLSSSTWLSSSEFTKFTFADFASIENEYYSNLISWYYEQGQRDADSSTLIRGFSAIVGILVNFVLLILNLSIFDVSLMSIFSLLALFVGIVWILKLIRG